MDISAYLVGWTEAAKRLEENSALGESLGEAAEENQKWIKSLDWFPPSANYYFACAEAWESIRGANGVPPSVDAKARNFMDHLITYSDYCQELSPEAFFLSISPESAEKFASLFADIEFAVYRDAFYSKTSENTRRDVARFSSSEDPDRGFEESFLPYIRSFGRALTLAAKQKTGLLITMF